MAGQFIASHRIWGAALGAAAIIAVVLLLVLPGGSVSNTASAGRIPTNAQTDPLAQPTPTDVASTNGLTTDGTGQPTDQPSDPASATQTPAPTAAGQAADIQLILTASGAARATLAQALPDLEACGDIPGDIALLHAAAHTRADLLRRTAGMSTDLLPAGAAMLADLRRALSASIVADESYAAWGTTLLSEQPCNGNGNGNPHWAAAKAADVQATSAKSAFVAVWNALAPQMGVTPIQATQF